MNKVVIIIEHLKNGYWGAWYKVDTKDQQFKDSCGSFHDYKEAFIWTTSQITYIEEVLIPNFC